MTTLQLECFLEAAKDRSFSLAASNLYLSQPTLSRQISALEEELSAALFIRANNAVRLSEVGRKLYPRIEAMYRAYRASSDELRELARSASGRLRVGVQASLLPPPEAGAALRACRAGHPGSDVLLYHLDLQSCCEALMEESVDALLSLDSSMPLSDKLDALTLKKERMCLAVPAGHPNSSLPEVRQSEISRLFGDLPFLVMDADAFEAPLKPRLEQVFQGDSSLDPRPFAGPYAGLDSLLLMADAGLGVTCVSEGSLLRENPRVKLIPLLRDEGHGPVPQTVSLTLYWLKKNGNPLLLDFLKALRG